MTITFRAADIGGVTTLGTARVCSGKSLRGGSGQIAVSPVKRGKHGARVKNDLEPDEIERRFQKAKAQISARRFT